MSAPARAADRAELQRALERAVSGEVRFDPYSRALYSTDASIYRIEPIGVVLPRNADDVQAVIEVCHRDGVWVLPRGGGTSLSGQTVNHAIVLDFSKYMHDVLEIKPDEGWVRTQPGITLDELNRQVRPHELFFTPDPSTSSRANVGGAIGNNSCGANSIRYGRTVDHVLEQDVVLSDGSRALFKKVTGRETEAKLSAAGLEGSIYRSVRQIAQDSRDEADRRFPKILRRNGGYNIDRVLRGDAMDLTQIMVGSEGTLAAVTSPKLHLERIPKTKGLAVVHFNGIIEAMEATVATLEEKPTAVEHIGSMIIKEARRSLGFARNLGFLQGEPQDILVVEFSGETEAEVVAALDRLENRLRRQRLGYATTRLLSPAGQRQVWNMRQAGLGLMMNVPGPAKPLPFVEDTAVAPEKLPEYVRRFDEIMKKHGNEAGYYGHASVGCLHIRPVIDIKTRDGMEKLQAIAGDVADLVLEFGGAMTAEHGDGIVRGYWTEKMFGPKLTQAFRDVKAAFDPAGIMNPGKVFDTPHLLSNLRYDDRYRTQPLQTRLSFRKEGGFAGAVEMCNGVGACRKFNAGAMCPSFMATREEEHSTRGRANALRAALSGALPLDELHSTRMFQVLDLCLECKSCKSECPSGVDMAKIKYEFLDGYYRSHRLPLRSRMVAGIHRLNALTSPIAPVANLVNRSVPVRMLLDAFVGFDYHRPMPPVVRRTFQRWWDGHVPTARGSRGEVVLFHDTFMNFNYPSIGIAATRLLEALGYDVVVLRDRRCCGRPMVSKGLLDKAAANARHNVDLLYPYVERGVPVVGCESSCVMAIKDEYADLLDDDRSRAVAAGTTMIEELIAKTAGDGGGQIEFKNDLKRDVAFLGHCHQRALTGTVASLKALRLPPGYRVSEINAGCCGMAGSFGYEKEHVGVSLGVGEDRFFPFVRAASPETQIAVTGVSCREQTQFGTGRKARHLVEVLADALKEPSDAGKA
ncbi:MAG: FAD-binding protein [Chloroflexi bacterium]|nr:FAD-binding protein [Chloroflexota bacterium]